MTWNVSYPLFRITQTTSVGDVHLTPSLKIEPHLHEAGDASDWPEDAIEVWIMLSPLSSNSMATNENYIIVKKKKKRQHYFCDFALENVSTCKSIQQLNSDLYGGEIH